MKSKSFAAAFLLLLPLAPSAAGAAEVMTLQQCRDSAVRNNISLKMAQQKVTLAGYDRKIAMANYFPGISVSGAYMYNSRNLSLLSQEKSDMLTGLGTGIQGSLRSGLENLMSDPVFSAILQENPGMMKLMEDKAYRKRLSDNAKKIVSTYSEETVMNRWIGLFNSLIHK